MKTLFRKHEKMNHSLSTIDPEIAAYISKEHQRQNDTLNLIASENYASHAVREATGSCFTNKYAEGYPSKRYYAGCEWADAMEQCAIDRCKQLFGSVHANVQPHAGSQANMAVYAALLAPGDCILGMNLAAGGHLTHGHKVNLSGKWFHAVQYGVHKETERLDFEEIRMLAHQHKPKLIIAGASAYSRIIDFAQFKAIADEVGAYFLADIAHIAGLVVTQLHPSPVGSADVVTSTTHKTLRGPRGGIIMGNSTVADQIDKTIIPGTQGGPLLHVIAAKAVAFKEAMSNEFKVYQQQVITNAQTIAHTLTTLGYRIVTGGTDNHLFIVDLRNKKINGTSAQDALEQAGIIVNKNCIPFDPEKPWVTSGIRIGTPAITTRGMGIKECEQIAQLIDEAMTHHADPQILATINTKVKTMTAQFPLG